MLPAVRPGNHLATIASLSGSAGLMLALFVATAQGSTQSNASEQKVASAESSVSSGEIAYTFDSDLNRTNARFKTALESGNIISRMFSRSPVHTLIAVYDFGGRTRLNPPDAVRLTLISDEFRQGVPDRFSPGPPPILILVVADRELRYPLGIAQRTEVWSAPDGGSPAFRDHVTGDPNINRNAIQSHVHVERTATAMIPTCEFLAIVNATNVHGTVAGLDFELSKGVVSGLRTFAAEMASGVSAQAVGNCGSR
ncbi:MAG TPA: hypothetical protein VF850_06465 [Gemmatimonadaceae bacterium]